MSTLSNPDIWKMHGGRERTSIGRRRAGRGQRGQRVLSETKADIGTHRLAEHATNKHSKTMAECFPGFVEQPKK